MMAQGRVLVVDDEKNIRFVIAQCLEQAGYTVDVAVDGEHGLQKLAEQPYDLMLLDLKLPGIDGMEVLSQSHRIRPYLPVIMMTAHGTIETAVEAMKLGALDYLQKPFNPDEILAQVARVLRRRDLPLQEPAAEFDTCVEQAKKLIHQRDFTRAAAFLRQALTLDTLRPEPYNLLGCIEELLGNVPEAQRLYRAALSVSPGYAPAHTNLHRTIQMFQLDPPEPDLGESEEEEA